MHASERAAAASPAPTDPYPAPCVAAYVIGVLFAITLMSQLDRQLPALLVAPLRAEFGISDTAFSVLQSYAFALPFTLMGLPLGRLVDTHNRRNLVCVGLLFWSAATALFAFGRSYDALVLARVGVGMGEAVLAPAAFSLIADLVAPQRRGRALAVYSISIAVGSGASLLLGGWLMAVIPAQGLALGSLGALPAWRVAFIAAALPGLPLALLLLTTVHEPARQRDAAAAPRSGPSGAREVPANGRDRSMLAIVGNATAATGVRGQQEHEQEPEQQQPRTQQPTVADFTAYLRRQPATFARLLCYPAVLAFIGYGSLGWAPALFARSHAMAPAQAGMVLGIGVAVAGSLGLLGGGFLSDGWLARGVPAARLRVALVGLAIAAPPAVLWPLVPGAGLAFGLLFVLVFGIAVAQSAVPTSVQAVFPNRMRGQAVGSYLLLTGLLGIGLGPTAIALVTDHVFHDDLALGRAIALTAGPAALLGLWVIASGLAPYARTHAAADVEDAPPCPASHPRHPH